MAGPKPSIPALTDSAVRGLILFWFGIAAFRLWVASTLGLAADEAYYWTWSQDLAWGYYDHPPAIAAWIRMSTSVFGNTELGVRALGLLFQSAVLLGLVLMFRKDTKGDPWLLSLLLAMPLFFLGGILATPDIPLLLAWVLGLMALQKQRWMIFGVCCGLAMLSKLTGVLLWPVAFLGLPEARIPLLASGLLAAIILVPFLLWQADHDWVSIAFQLDHGFGNGVGGLSGVFEGIAGQAGIVGPFLFLAAAIWVCRPQRTNRLMWWSFVLPALAFLMTGFSARPEANWMAPAWVGACWGLAESGGRLRRLSWVGAVSGVLLSLLVVFHAVFSLWSLPKDPVDRLRMGPLLSAKVADWGVEQVVCERYQEAAWLAFYTDIETTTLPNFSRSDQFDLWERPALGEGLYLRVASGRDLEAEEHWDRIWDDTRFRVSHRGRKIGGWQVYRTAEAR